MKSAAVFYEKGSSESEGVPLIKLVPHKEEWLEAIDNAIRRIHDIRGEE